MVKLIGALLMLMLALVGPAAAQDPEPSNEEPPADEAEPSSDDTQTQDAESADGSASEGSNSDSTANSMTAEQQQHVCRVVVTHVADPTMSADRWIIPDPDGCIQRTIERLIGPTGQAILRSIL